MKHGAARRPENAASFHPAEKPSTLPLVLSLSGVLSSTYVLYQKSLYYHWNVKGPNFYGLHKLFEEHYEELHKAGDTIAERIRALGHLAPGTLHDFLELSSIKEDKSLPESSGIMLQNLLSSHEVCARKAHEALVMAEKEDDLATADLMIRRIAFHDKAAWMLRSLLSQEFQEPLSAPENL